MCQDHGEALAGQVVGLGFAELGEDIPNVFGPLLEGFFAVGWLLARHSSPFNSLRCISTLFTSIVQAAILANFSMPKGLRSPHNTKLTLERSGGGGASSLPPP